MPFSKKIILLADDSETFVMYISILLSRMGFNIIPAQDGVEVLKLLKIITPDLVILDEKMPEAGGIDVLRKMREHAKLSEIPAIMVSTEADEGLARECRQLGCAGLLTKPVKVERLHQAVQEALYIQLGWKRKHLRASSNIRVQVSSGGVTEELFTESLSEGGVYIRRQHPLPVGTELRVVISDGRKAVSVKGRVIYIKRIFGDVFRVSPGMAIEFFDVAKEDSIALSNYVSRLLVENIIEGQDNSTIAIGDEGPSGVKAARRKRDGTPAHVPNAALDI